MKPLAMLIDITRCTGCEDCVAACKQEHELGDDVPRRWKLRIDDLSSTRYTTMIRRPGDRHVRQLCRHCLEPACVSACLVGALQKTPEGPVTYDAERCMGCRYCMASCPYEIPRYDWEESVPKVRKCTLCSHRLAEGGVPACVEACEREVMLFGPREEVLREAHARIDAEPTRYVDRVFGEHEVGGTSVLYLSDIPLDFLGARPELGNDPLPELTWAALSKVPPLVIGMSALMAGTWWITGRRNQLAEERLRAAGAAAAMEADASHDDEGGQQ